MSSSLIYGLVVIIAVLSNARAFSLTRSSGTCLSSPMDHRSIQPINQVVARRQMDLNLFPNLQSIFLAEGGLDAETLESLGDLQELNEALDGAIDAANPAVGILSKLVASPAFLAIPIGAGVAVSFIIGYFIFSYGQGKDD